MKHWEQNDRVFFELIKGRLIAGQVLETARSDKGDYQLVRIRIAVENPLTGGMIVLDYPKPIPGYKLKKRGTIISELGEREEL